MQILNGIVNYLVRRVLIINRMHRKLNVRGYENRKRLSKQIPPPPENIQTHTETQTQKPCVSKPGWISRLHASLLGAIPADSIEVSMAAGDVLSRMLLLMKLPLSFR